MSELYRLTGAQKRYGGRAALDVERVPRVQKPGTFSFFIRRNYCRPCRFILRGYLGQEPIK